MKIGQCFWVLQNVLLFVYISFSFFSISICLFGILVCFFPPESLYIATVVAVDGGDDIVIVIVVAPFLPIWSFIKCNMSVCVCLRQSVDWDCGTQMENKFVTVAHLQQIPELCLLIKGSNNSSRKKTKTTTVTTATTCIHSHTTQQLQYVIITINKIYRVIVNS